MVPSQLPAASTLPVHRTFTACSPVPDSWATGAPLDRLTGPCSNLSIAIRKPVHDDRIYSITRQCEPVMSRQGGKCIIVCIKVPMH